MANHTCAESDWNVENGAEDPSGGLALTFDLIWSIADSENLKILSRRGGSTLAVTSPLVADLAGSGASDGGERLSLTRVLRALVRSRKGGTEMEVDPQQSSAQEVMKCHVEVPSSTA